MKVSVVVPVYNEEKYIGTCLRSLANQTQKPFEIIVVDDGSDDNSKLEIKKSFRHFKSTINLIYLKQKHSGPSKARNLGAKKAQGDILLFPDADMKFDRQYLKKLTQPIWAGKAQATFTKEEYVANLDNIWAYLWSINDRFSPRYRVDPNMPDWANNFRAIRRDIFLSTKGYQDIGYGEDVTVLAQLQGVKAKKAKGAICYHFNPLSLKEVYLSARWIGRGETINHHLKSLLTFTLPNSLRKGIGQSIRYRQPAYLLFKIVFDFGILLGLVSRMLGGGHAK